MTVGLYTSVEERCGIAAYSRGLMAALREELCVEVTAASFAALPPRRYREHAERLNAADVTHVQHSYAFFGGMGPTRLGARALLTAIRRPLVVTVHELDLRATGAYHLPPVAEIAYKRWFNRQSLVLPNLGAWIVHAEPLRAGLLELGAPAERVHRLPMPVPAAGPLLDPGQAKRRWGLEGRRVLTIFGFLARRKGYDVALAALPHLPPDTLLMAAGGAHAADRTHPEAWLQDEAARLGVADRLLITGFLAPEDVPLAMAASDVVLAPFREMSASASLPTAIAYGRPIVASDLEPNRAMDCVALAPVGQPEALARVVEELLTDPARQENLRLRMAAYAADHSYAALARSTRTIYEQLLCHAHRH